MKICMDEEKEKVVCQNREAWIETVKNCVTKTFNRIIYAKNERSWIHIGPRGELCVICASSNGYGSYYEIFCQFLYFYVNSDAQ